MIKLSFFLAQKMLLANRYQKGISVMTTICFTGIFIGSFSLAVVTAIMRGFEVAIEKKMQGIHSDIIINGYGSPINMKALTPVLQNEFPEIAAYSIHTTRHALLHQKDTPHETPQVIMLNAINPATEKLTSALHQKIILPRSQSFEQLFENDHIIIGKQLAEQHNLTVNDTIELLFISDEKVHHNKVHFDSQTVTIGGIFNTGIDEFDSSIIYCSFSLLKKMFPHIAVEQINLSLHNHENDSLIIQKLKKRIGLAVYSWKDLYPSLIAAQKLEKYVSFFIIALIVLVACMNIISLLYMQITQKRHDVAILKAMGMTNTTLSTIFFIIGLAISTVASLLGLGCALLVSYILEQFPFITLPDSYYVTHMPIAMEWHILVAVLLIVLIFSFFATWFSVKQIKTINISQVLRFEG